MRSERRQRDHRITIRLTREEWEKAQTYADRAGVSVAELFRRQTLGREIHSPLIDPEGTAAIVDQLRRIGTNLNQLARAIHMGQAVGDLHEIAETWKEVNTLRQLLNSQAPNQQTD